MGQSINHKIKTAIRLFREATYFYSDRKYPDSFMSKYTSSQSVDVLDIKVDRVIYVFWTGQNEMSKNRKTGIATLQELSGVPVILVTPKNLNDYILKDDPLPDCYQYLSCVHKADYLRAYFMYHYGGGYSDVKAHYNSWVPVFDRIDTSSAYIIGYPEICHDVVAMPDDYETKIELMIFWRLLIGTGSFICRPYTRFTDEWYREMKRRVLLKSEDLKLHPATDPRGYNNDYPIRWMYILGEIFHPLCLKYHRRVIQDGLLKPDFDNYL